MARMHKWLGLALLVGSLTGCVSQEKYNAMKLRADQLAEQAGQSDAEAQRERAQADAYKSQLEQLSSSGNTSTAMMANQTQQIAALSSQLAEIKAKYEDALARPATVVTLGGSALPQPLTNALTEFANANSDVVDFDAARGIVKFKSDVTFAPGSTEVSGKATSAIERFAQILNSSGASGYELMVAGHTDNTPVVRADTKAHGNYDNWYLSTHRAISVAAVLVQDGVSSGRLGVAGYADKRPIASNASEAGKAQNRRVEILILPNTVRSVMNANASTASHRTPRASLNKDSNITADIRPALNK
ncbi:MAG: OmpA family protein [Planctomycetota bacterium]|nr:OmpA family protein [Planctomycetota bacterium]